MKLPVLELVKIGKYFSDDFALRDISLDLYPGEVHVVVGENGSGKSAIMKIISGIYRRDTGEILVDGQPVAFSSVREAKMRGIFYQLQDPQLFGNLTVAENIYFDCMPRTERPFHSIHRYRLLAECRRLFADLGISIACDAPVWTLGYAQQQLVEAVKTCVADARIVIFDEPSASMTDPERQILFRIVTDLKNKGAGILYISHRIDEITQVADRITVIHQGSVVNTCANTHLDHDTLFRIMTGRIRKERYPRITVRPGPEILAVRHLRSDHILRDVSFALRKSEILGITGLMGSGRTRLANCLFGVVQPTGGTISVAGKEVSFNHPNDALKSGLALIPEDRQENAMFPLHDLTNNMTIVALHRFLYGISTNIRFMRQLVKEYTDRLQIRPGNQHDLLHTYSGGNQQKVMIARWLMQRASIYIMDEPTRGIDVAAKIDIYNAMNDLVTKGASIIFISSEIEEILGLCDRILVLAGGKIVCDLPREEATKERILAFATNEE